MNISSHYIAKRTTLLFVLLTTACLFLLGCSNSTMRHYLEPRPAASSTEQDSTGGK